MSLVFDVLLILCGGKHNIHAFHLFYSKSYMVSPMACFQCAVGQTISMLSALTLTAMIFFLLFFLRLLNLFILHFKLYCRLRINKTISIVVLFFASDH